MNNLKLLDLIARLAKKDVEIGLPTGKVLKWQAPIKVSISSLFFRDGQCMRCGRSCKVSFDLFWFENEYYNLPSPLKEKLKVISIQVNGKEKHLWTYKNPVNITPECALVEEKDNIYECTIHNYKPIHCALPPIQIDSKKGRTLLTKRLFGRNYKFGCKIKFKEFDRKQFINWDVVQLDRLKKASEYLEIPTYLDEIIAELVKVIITQVVPDKQIVIYEQK